MADPDNSPPAVFISPCGADRFGRCFVAARGRGWRFSVFPVYRRRALVGWSVLVSRAGGGVMPRRVSEWDVEQIGRAPVCTVAA